MISVSALEKAFGPQVLFRDVGFQLNAAECFGLVGANGSGKSTLLRILSGEEPPTSGTVSIPKRLRVGVLGQDHFRYDERRILDVALMGNRQLWAAMEEKQCLLERAESSFDAERYAELEDVVVRHDGYTAEARAAEILEGLGIPAAVHGETMSTLSGGFKLRVLLAQTLAARPQALLLDEPTNHLDILSIRWLEKFLVDFSGIAVVISHDHRFLDNISTHILDVDYETVTLYTGNYSRFVKQKAAERRRKQKEIEKREKDIAHHQAFVERFRAKATKARQAQSKVRLMEKMASGLETLPTSSRRYPRFVFRQRRPSGREVLTLEGIGKSYGDNQVLADVSLEVRRRDRLAILGPNGIGKSTLLRIAMGHLEPDAGSVEWGYETHPGYFAQDHRELLAAEKQSVEAWLWESCPAEPVGFVRGQLADVLFSKDEVHKPLGSLSGGEGARLVFARLAVEQPNVLVLDEPTNHLDLEAIEALVKGLEGFPGTLVFVSHDRWFVSRLANRILEIRPDGIRDYPGGYEDYVADCGDDHLDAETVALKARREKRRAKAIRQGRGMGPSKNERRKLESACDQLARRIEAAEERVHEINEIFCDPTYFDRAPRQEARRLESEQTKLKERIATLTTEWEAAEEKLAALGPSG